MVQAHGTGTWYRYVVTGAGHTSPCRAFDSLRICYEESFRRNAGCLRSLPYYTDVSVICFTQADFFSAQCIRLSVSVLTILHVVFFARYKVAILLFDRHLCCAADVQVFPYLKWFC